MFSLKNKWNSLLGAREKEERIKELKKICDEYTNNREQLLANAGTLYYLRKGYLNDIVTIIEIVDAIDNVPTWCEEDLKSSFRRVQDFMTAVKYEKDPKKFTEITDKTGRTAAYVSAGTAAGAAIATLGPTAAMSLATVLGTASTGTAISALSGVAATNAALAWLGGGTLAAGGAGIAGGNLVLGMFGPIGIAIAGVSAASGLAFIRSKNRKLAEEASRNIAIISHDNLNLTQKLQHLKLIMNNSEYNNVHRLQPALVWIKGVDPKDYKLWNDEQKHELEKLANTTSNTVQLINERI